MTWLSSAMYKEREARYLLSCSRTMWEIFMVSYTTILLHEHRHKCIHSYVKFRWGTLVSIKNRQLWSCKPHYNEAHRGLFCCTMSGKRHNSNCTRAISSLNVNVSITWKCLPFLTLSSFFLQFSLILESLGLFRCLALSGNDVNRVKCFWGPRGRTTQSDCGEWLTSTEKCGEENTLRFFIYLRRLILSVIHVCVQHISQQHTIFT